MSAGLLREHVHDNTQERYSPQPLILSPQSFLHGSFLHTNLMSVSIILLT